MKISPGVSGSSEFLAVFSDAIQNYTTSRKGDPERLHNLRCSQLPYCPSTVLLDYAQKGLRQDMDMLMAYYVTVGTAVHEVMQTYLAQSGNFLADYHCRECGSHYPLSHKHECCGFPTQYHEVSIDWNGIKGHIDGIFRDSKGNYWIVDFKTTSVEASAKKKSSPGDGYVRQVRAYAWLLRKQYGIEVAGCMLVFLPRDNPKHPVIWEYRIKETDWDEFKEELRRDRSLHRATMRASSIEEMEPLLAHGCGNVFCEGCKTPMQKKIDLLTPLLGAFPIIKENKDEA